MRRGRGTDGLVAESWFCIFVACHSFLFFFLSIRESLYDPADMHCWSAVWSVCVSNL